MRQLRQDVLGGVATHRERGGKQGSGLFLRLEDGTVVQHEVEAAGADDQRQQEH